MLTYAIGRELLKNRGARHEVAAAEAGGAAATAAGAATADVEREGPGLEEAPRPALLRVPVGIGLDDAKGLFKLHFGQSPSGGPPDGASGAIEAEALEEALEEVLGSLQELRLGPGEEGGGGGSSNEVPAAVPLPPAPPPHTIPKLSICIMICGTRGDVQPFIPLGRALQAFGHRVRLASHAIYRDFVQGFGLEFYPLGGDPEILSEFIVRNRGVVPKLNAIPLALSSTEQVKEVLRSTYKACTEADPGDPAARPFTAQAIIANPPSYGHIHCAEKLGVPLHMCFTMPWTPTAEYVCPLTHASISSAALNKLSWGVVMDFIWSGMLHMINSWRQHELGLQPIRTGNHGGILTHVHKVPFMYCWSSAVVPKPADWPSFTDVVGYFFLDEGSLHSYEPPPELAAFLEAGTPPVYVGFGSLVMDDPQGLTRKVVDAAAAAGVRLLLSKGWGGLGEGLESPAPKGVLLLDKPCPHDWLFSRCTAVVHHGGAGTTAAGLKAGKPTAIIPVFGDQHFWGAAVNRMGLGPPAIPIDELTTEGLVDALRFMQRTEVRAAAVAAAAQIGQEDGVAAAVDCFHRHLPLRKLAAGERSVWDLASPQLSNLWYETGAGFVNVWTRPIVGAKRGGVAGAMKGAGKGLADLAYRPAKGIVLSGMALGQIASGSRNADNNIGGDAGGEE